MDRFPGDVDRFGGTTANFLADPDELVDAAEAGQYDEYLVTSCPADGVFLADRLADPGRHVVSTASPMLCPQVSLMSLKWSTSQNKMPRCFPGAGGSSRAD